MSMPAALCATGTGTWFKRLGPADRQEPLTARLIDQLASRYSVTRGKWMCFPVPHAVDVLWDDLAMALAAGALDPATEIKVAPRYDSLSVWLSRVQSSVH
jgi:hypothetical protein